MPGWRGRRPTFATWSEAMASCVQFLFPALLSLSPPPSDTLTYSANSGVFASCWGNCHVWNDSNAALQIWPRDWPTDFFLVRRCCPNLFTRRKWEEAAELCSGSSWSPSRQNGAWCRPFLGGPWAWVAALGREPAERGGPPPQGFCQLPAGSSGTWESLNAAESPGGRGDSSASSRAASCRGTTMETFPASCVCSRPLALADTPWTSGRWRPRPQRAAPGPRAAPRTTS